MHNGRYTNMFVKDAIKKLRILDDYLEPDKDGRWGTPVRRRLAYNLTGELIILMCDLETTLATTDLTPPGDI